MKVVMVTGSLGEGAGGLASAVRAWADGLATAGVEVTIFCLDLTTTFGRSLPPSHPRVEVVEVPCWIEPRTRLILAPRLQRSLHRHCIERGIDVIHANGIWLPGTRIAARVARLFDVPFVISPHGHLQPWAMAHRGFKKRVAWYLYGRRSLTNASVVQSASSRESESIQALRVETPVAVVPNIVAFPTDWPNAPASDDPRKTALFLSRIHPSKGLMDLVEAWSQLRPEGWRVVVAGYDEVGQLAEIKQAVSQRKLQNDFAFVGPVSYESRWLWYRAANLFVLPSYSENFGVCIAEALAAKVPVITTRAAPWASLVENRCGWWIDTGAESLRAALGEATALDDEDRAVMGARGQELALAQYSAEVVTQELLAMYRRTF